MIKDQLLLEKKSHSKDSVIQSEGEDVLLSKAKNLEGTKWMSPRFFTTLRSVLNDNILTIILILLLALLPSCITEDIQDNTPQGNFEALWRIIDTKYCFLDYKHEEYGLDWDEVYRQYSNRLTKDMSKKELFQVLAG